MNKRKEFKKLNLPLKLALRKMFKKYGFDLTIRHIENMKSPSQYERCLMIDYIFSLRNN